MLIRYLDFKNAVWGLLTDYAQNQSLNNNEFIPVRD